MKVTKRLYSSSSAEAAAPSDDVSEVNVFSSISHSSFPFIFFFFSGTSTGTESTKWFVLISTNDLLLLPRFQL
jgi:hypothetical protein